MPETTLTFRLITPDGASVEDTVAYIQLPSASGELGILASHSHSVIELAPGKVLLNTDEDGSPEGQKDAFFLSRGFAHITPNTVTVMTPHFERVSDIDKARAESARHRAMERMANTHDDIDKDRALHALRRAEQRLDLIHGFK